jgi:antitoxin YefM
VNSITINQFKNNLQDFIKQVINKHIPIKITNQDGEDFILVSAEDWNNRKPYLFYKIVI